MTRPRALRYAPNAEIERLIELARRHGVRIGGIILKGDGSVHVLDERAARAMADQGADDEISRKLEELDG